MKKVIALTKPTQKGYLQRMQDASYQLMARTVWDSVVSGFAPGRVRALELLDIKPSDRLLFVGEGSGLDFPYLPEQTNKDQLYAFDFSSEMSFLSSLTRLLGSA